MPAPTHYIPDWSTGYRFGHALTRCAALGLVIRLLPLHPSWLDGAYWRARAQEAATTCPACDGNGQALVEHVPTPEFGGGWDHWTICPACGGSGLARELREEA